MLQGGCTKNGGPKGHMLIALSYFYFPESPRDILSLNSLKDMLRAGGENIMGIQAGHPTMKSIGGRHSHSEQGVAVGVLRNAIRCTPMIAEIMGP